ncbi:hypothetical protein ACS2CM_23790 [Bacillus cereus group sp. BceL309]|uniref:hypothetical protein n=1 Tax=Bacillus cereus group sp. BceL309 TaxID=3444976 RepID=UPI003EC73950
MDRKELAKELTVAFLQNKSDSIHSIDDAVHVYEKFHDAVHRSEHVKDHVWVEAEDFIRNNK